MSGHIRVGIRGSSFIDEKFKDYKNIVVMTPSQVPAWYSLSPYDLKTADGVIHENLYQSSKVYAHLPKSKQYYSRYDHRVIWDRPAETHMVNDNLNDSYKKWRDDLQDAKDAIRYPEGFHYRKNVKYSIDAPYHATLEDLNNRPKLNYIEARKQIYLRYYLKLVKNVPAFIKLKSMVEKGVNIMILEIDGPHQESLPYYKDRYGVKNDFIESASMLATPKNLDIMLNDSKHPFGHGYCIAWALLDLPLPQGVVDDPEINIPNLNMTSTNSKNRDIIISHISYVNDVEVLSKILSMLIHDTDNKNISIGAYINWSSSCFLDSLLMIMFLSDESKYFIDAINTSNIDNIEYNPIIFEMNSNVKTAYDIKKLILNLKTSLLDDYERISTHNEVIKCTNIRQLLSIFHPSMLGKRGGWVQSSPDDMYTLLSNIFSKMLIDSYPYTLMPSGVIRYSQQPISAFITSDYLNEIGDVGTYPLWSSITNPYIVFLQSVGSEESTVRSFSEHIIDNRYELYASIVMLGIIPKSYLANKESAKSSGHYITYFKLNGQWVLYDDLYPNKLELLDGVPEKAYSRQHRSIPNLMFYKLSDTK